ncbi:MAG: molybdopterin-dependent oxidoreductase [Actinobacteria bacterium]|jgi:arsenite oxidase large subunit|nr:molybdopterin-dependent oxidoreductase [Actinomycetota bacterium]
MTNIVPIPPVDAVQHTTACEYCPVACGYKVFTWPLNTNGGEEAANNALGRDIPVGPLAGGWISDTMHTVVRVNGEKQHCVVLPDPDAKVVNVGGTHSVRGGALAQKLYREDGPTSDRLSTPLLRVDGNLVPVTWEVALDLVARLSTSVIEEHGELAWGMKIYSYEFFENTYAGSKLALGAIGTPNFSPHHAPADGDDVPGLSDAGIDAFGTSFSDDQAADVLFIAGSDPYETKSVRFTGWQATGGANIVYVDPRRTFTAVWAENHDGIHLQLKPGTDACLYNALVRYILDNGWEDQEFIEQYLASREEIDAEGKWRRVEFGRTVEELHEYLRSNDEFTPEGAEVVTGVPADKIRAAAELISGGSGAQPKTSVLFEKGVYWTHNYENTAAIANLGLVLGASGREGRATARMGGHQRGGQKAASYPMEKSPHSVMGHPIEMDTERWLVEGNTRFRWVVGTNWLGAMAATGRLRRTVEELTTKGPGVTSTDPETAFSQLQARIDAGGMVLVHQEIYANESTRYADLVLPAATWGEEDFTRNNAERRLRLYQGFMDAPGEAKPDWWIFAEVGKRMGFEGFDWKDTNEIFEELSPRTSGGRKDNTALVELAQDKGMRAHDLLATYGTQGLQTPLTRDGDDLQETVRLHEDLRFKSDSKKANFVFPDWEAVKERMKELVPRADKGEVWVLNGRVNALWNNMSDYTRRPLAKNRWPQNPLEVNPEDAKEWGLEAGDLVSIECEDVLDQVGERAPGSFTAVVYPTDVVPRGITFTYFLYPGAAANNVTPADTTMSPLSLRNPFKLGRGRITRLGKSGAVDMMSFAPRNLAPGGK